MRISDDQAAGLDETRRLLYMAATASNTDHYELAGTLVNTLVHHVGASVGIEIDSRDAVAKVLALLSGETSAVEWADQVIDAISMALSQ